MKLLLRKGAKLDKDLFVPDTTRKSAMSGHGMVLEWLLELGGARLWSERAGEEAACLGRVG